MKLYVLIEKTMLPNFFYKTDDHCGGGGMIDLVEFTLLFSSEKPLFCRQSDQLPVTASGLR
jgi:hypothetical protein